MKKFLLLLLLVNLSNVAFAEKVQTISSKNILSPSTNTGVIVQDDFHKTINYSKEIEDDFKRGEFDSNEDFKNRVASANLKKNIFLSTTYLFVAPKNSYSLTYNPEKNNFLFKTESKAFQPSAYIYPAISMERETVSDKEKEVQNAYGAQFTIRQIRERSTGFCFRNLDNMLMKIFSPIPSDIIRFEFPMAINDAKAKKGNIETIFVIRPSFERDGWEKETFITEHFSNSEATFSNRTGYSDMGPYLNAKLLAIFVYDNKEKKILHRQYYSYKPEEKDIKKPANDSYITY